MTGNGVLRFLAAICLVFALAGCKSSAERAEEHYQSALALVAAGDTDRAAVEFRNVFRLNGQHIEARRAYAAMLLDTGRPEGAFSQYLRLVEQVPDDPAGTIALARIAISLQSWPEARRYGARALELAPDDPSVKVIGLNLQYAEAIEKSDEPARQAAAEAAAALSETVPDDLSLRRILVDSALRDQKFDTALEQIEAALAVAPDERELWNTRLSILAQQNRLDETEALLKEMVAKFPEDEELKGTLVRFYVSRGQSAEAEAFLRELMTQATDPEARTSLQVTLVQFLLVTRGADAALAEIDTLLAAEADAVTLRTVRAGIEFEKGNREAAIAGLQALVDENTDPEAAERLRPVKVALAKMLDETGNAVGARRLVEEVLAEAPDTVEAMKMKAAWLIGEDKTDEAIGLLRAALDAAPEDVGAMTLTAQAHERNGDRDLARDFLSLAVEASDAAPEPSLRYAGALLVNDRLQTAEEVLIRALRQTPDHPQLLLRLGQLYLRMEDWPRAEQVEKSLRGLDQPEMARAADDLTAQRLALQGRADESIAFLEELAGRNQGDVGAQVAVIRARLTQGDREGALAYAREALAAAPDNLVLQFAVASVEASVGDAAAAEAAYRAIVAAEPGSVRAWLGLVRLKTAAGDPAAAEAAVDEAMAALPDNPDLIWAKAGFREKAGDIDGAIALQERLYELAPNSPIAANNLASLISSYRDDEVSLGRAYAVARRLKGTTVPAFQDTYGWIAYRRGAFAEALEYLEPAAQGLAGDALVQFHLGMTYLALERRPEALAVLKRALEVAGPDDPRTQFATARDEVAKLEAAGVVPAAAPETPAPDTPAPDAPAPDTPAPDAPAPGTEGQGGD
jgi:tetratricopeptide (TPR) repeat protein